MDIYILDDLLRRVILVDVYISLIWKERYSEYGSFELVMHNNRENTINFALDQQFVILESQLVMRVETNEVNSDSEGNDILTITGRSTMILTEDRVAMPALAGLSTTAKWEITGTPGDVVRAIFITICVNGDLNENDIIPFYTPGLLNPAGDIPESVEEVAFALDPDTLYATIKKICDVYKLGFRLVRNGDTSELYFEVYTGDDRTSTQTNNTPIIFSQIMDTLSDVKSITSNAGYKNVAYVFGATEVAVVYADNTSSTISGFDRRVLIVQADDIDLATGPELTAALEQRGREELSKYRSVIAFDGEIPQNSTYKYRVDYNLGDLVELRENSGKINNMRVTEQIFVSDIEGVRSYPTLSFDQLITPGTWLSWDATQVWADTTEMWADA